MRITLIVSLFLLFCGVSHAGMVTNPYTGVGDFCITLSEEDGSPKMFCPNEVKVTNGSLIDNGDGTASLSVGGGGGGDAVSIDGSAVTDPNFASTGDIDFVNTSNTVTANINANSVSADELNATGVEAELEAVMDLQDMQGAVTDAQVPNNITIDLATLATTATTANSGDSATAFFSSGTIEDARIASTIARDSEVTSSISTHASNASAHHAPVTLAGTPDYITLTGQAITRALINLTTHVTGLLPSANMNWTDVDAGEIQQAGINWSSLNGNINSSGLNWSDFSDLTTGGAVVDDSHAHTGSTISGIDISDDTNLAGDTEIVLTGDTLSIASSIARDSELHSAVTVSGTPNYITLVGQDIVRGTVDISDDTNLTGDSEIVLTGDALSIASSIARDSELHSAVTVLDSSEIDFGLSGQQVTGSLKTGSIDVLKLDSGVQTSLGLADSALQSFTEVDPTVDSSAEIQAIIGAGVYQPSATVLTNTTASFTTTLETKLNGIEALADVTDTANVTSAGALMDSEVDADIKTMTIAASSSISGTNTGDQTTITGNAGTATALAANGANCSTGNYPLGVDASGAVESCTALPSSIANVVEDTTPQLGGTLDGENNDINDVKNLILKGTSVGTSGDGVVFIGIGVEPSSSPANGIQIYASDVSSGETEIASTGTATISAGSNAGNSNDENTATFATITSGSGNWLQINLGSAKVVNKIGIYHDDNLTNAPDDFLIQGCTGSGTGCTTLETVTNLGLSLDTWDYTTFTNVTSYQYYRLFDLTAVSEANTYFYELRLYEPGTASAEAKVRDEAGNITTFSPHNDELIPEVRKQERNQNSDGLAWTYNSKNSCEYENIRVDKKTSKQEVRCKEITVDMFTAIRALEKLSGEQFIFSNAEIKRPVGEVTIIDGSDKKKERK